MCPPGTGGETSGARIRLADGNRLCLLPVREGRTEDARPALLILNNSTTDQKLERRTAKPDVTVPQVGRLLNREDATKKPLALPHSHVPLTVHLEKDDPLWVSGARSRE